MQSKSFEPSRFETITIFVYHTHMLYHSRAHYVRKAVLDQKIVNRAILKYSDCQSFNIKLQESCLVLYQKKKKRSYMKYLLGLTILLGANLFASAGPKEDAFFDLYYSQGGVVQNYDISALKLSNANLQRIDLHGSLAVGVQLDGAAMAESDVSSVNFTKANLRGIDLNYSVANETNFSHADFSTNQNGESFLKQLMAINSDFSGANVNQANLEGANLTYSIFVKTSLRGTQLINAVLDEANLQGADLRGISLDKITDFSGASLENTNLVGAKFNNFTIMPFSGPDKPASERRRINTALGMIYQK